MKKNRWIILAAIALTLSLVSAEGAATPSGGGCDISADSQESWNTARCDAGGTGSMRCHGACGLGCKGCEVEETPGFCGWLCEPVTLHCYTRPCCQAHDDCLAVAVTQDEENACHAQATADGCGLADAAGTSNWEPDAECMDFFPCVSIFQKIGEVESHECSGTVQP